MMAAPPNRYANAVTTSQAWLMQTIIALSQINTAKNLEFFTKD